MPNDSSGDEFANYNPTTPARPAPTKKTTARSAHSKTNAFGGPSSRPGPATAKSAPKRTNGNAKAKPQEQIVIDSSSDGDTQRDELNEDDEEVIAVAPPPKAVTKKGPPGRASDTSAINKAKVSATKGKARADTQPAAKPSRNAPREEDVMDIDGTPNEEEEPSRKRVKYGPPGKQAKVTANANGGPGRTSKEQEAMVRENQRLARDNEDLRKEIETLKYERDQYSKQVQEALQIRTTEPEQALKEHIAVYESMTKNQQLWQQMANAASSPDNSQIPHFLSREAADAEKETSEKEVQRLKGLSRQKDAQLADKDKRIAELEAEAKQLRLELEQEIARAKTLASRPQPVAATRVNAKADGDVKNAAKVTSLYEDMTNLLVWGAKSERNQTSEKDEWIFNCIYTHGQQTEGESPSLNFLLRELWEPPEGGIGEPNRKCKYTPLMQVTPDWFERLEFFKEAFLFSWDQLPVFLKTLTDKVAMAINPDDADDDDEEEQADKTVEREVIMID